MTRTPHPPTSPTTRLWAWLGGLRDAAIASRWSLATGVALFVLAAVAFRSARGNASYWTIDDAGITYAAAYELADHGSLAPYVEGTPVESYSNPLLFFVVVLLRLVGVFDPVRTHVHLEMLVFASMITLVWSLLRTRTDELAAVMAAAVFAVIELVTPATRIWYGSGLENVWVSAGLVLLLWLCARTARGVALVPAWGAAAFAVAITRPEAPVYVAGFYLALVACARPAELDMRVHVRRVVRAAAVTAVLYVVFLCWRRFGYGDWWPNTYYAKVAGDASIADHVRDYVLGQVLHYGWSAVFACSVIALLLARKLEPIARCLLVLLAVSLALPITAGADWMGEHRFATAFLVVTHAAYAVMFAVCVAQRRKRGRVLTVVVALAVPALLVLERGLARPPVALNDVTLGHIARDQGAVRWLHQMRLGLPYPVVMVPDAGGSLLVGGMQLVDTASLADFQQPRILKYDASNATRLLAQYQHEERRADLVHFNPNAAAVDMSFLGTRYLRNESHLAVRRDLVELAAIDPAARLVLDAPGLSIYLSPDTVRRAAPGALVRCEVIVAWTGGAPAATTLRILVPGDEDEVSLAPYQAGRDRGIERRGLLVGAPRWPGTYPVIIELVRDGKPPLRATLAELDVRRDASDLPRIATELVRGATPHQAVRRIASLREQLVTRFTARYLQVLLRALYRERVAGGDVGLNIARLRWNARLAGLETLPAPARAAEAEAAHLLFATCPAGSGDQDALARRVLCLGRATDELRRLGYLAMLAREPAIARELAAARGQLDRVPTAARYQMLVGLTLADPGNIELQRDLLAARRAVAMAGAFPPL